MTVTNKIRTILLGLHKFYLLQINTNKYIKQEEIKEKKKQKIKLNKVPRNKKYKLKYEVTLYRIFSLEIKSYYVVFLKAGLK